MEGEIVVKCTVQCGNCLRTFWRRSEVTLRMFPTAAQLARMLRDDGWSKTIKLGWICPDCKAKKL